MISKNPKSVNMFNDDFKRTYGRIESRTVEILAEEASTEREQIQLVAEDPNMTISFNLPDGPPPADLRVEGEGAEELDIEQVRAFLQRKWEIFEGFNEPLKKALQTESLDEVNKVLGKMKVAEAEKVVELMQEGGMLSFRSVLVVVSLMLMLTSPQRERGQGHDAVVAVCRSSRSPHALSYGATFGVPANARLNPRIPSSSSSSRSSPSPRSRMTRATSRPARTRRSSSSPTSASSARTD